jgi:hypothetical protein
MKVNQQLINDFVVVWVCYLGVNLLDKSLHSLLWIKSICVDQKNI